MIDFKENIKLGGGLIETKKDFFSHQQILVLGLAIIYKKNNLTIIDYHSYLSNQLTHDSFFTGNCFNNFFNKNQLSKFNLILLWTDGGNHFKSQEFLYFLNLLSKSNNIPIQHNFFGEYHGKNIVDGHFERLSQWIKKIKLYEKIQSINHLYNFFIEKENERRRTKINTSESQKNPGNNYFHIYTAIPRKFIYYLKIKNIKNYLSFKFLNNKLLGSCITNNIELYENIDFTEEFKNDLRADKFTPPNISLSQHLIGQTSEQYQRRTKLRYETLKNFHK